MSYTVTQESFDSLAAYYSDPTNNLRWQLVFTLPDWLEVWWGSFGAGAEKYLIVVRRDEKILGIAPLHISDGTASIIGSTEVCDYLDFVVAEGVEKEFFGALLDDLEKKGVKRLVLAPLRPDSAAHAILLPLAEERGYRGELCLLEDVSVDMDLPAGWEEYLAMLDGKQRHEIKRKLGKLDKSGNNVSYSVVKGRDEVRTAMDTFLKLFSISRQDKAEFMTPQMESFFRSMVDAMAGAGVLKLGVLGLNGQPAAMVMYFDYNDCIYLYNSGYNPDYSSLSVGLISKVLCIKHAISTGRKKFDFLKGAESYKYYLGGKEIPLYRCQITLS